MTQKEKDREDRDKEGATESVSRLVGPRGCGGLGGQRSTSFTQVLHLRHPQRKAVHTPSHFVPHNRPGMLTGLWSLLPIYQKRKLRSRKAIFPNSGAKSKQSTQGLEHTSNALCHFALVLLWETVAWGCPEEFSGEEQARYRSGEPDSLEGIKGREKMIKGEEGLAVKGR